MKVTFRALDNHANDYVIGDLIWDGTNIMVRADCPIYGHFLMDLSQELMGKSDPVAEMSKLNRKYKSAYLRAEVIP